LRAIAQNCAELRGVLLLHLDVLHLGELVEVAALDVHAELLQVVVVVLERLVGREHAQRRRLREHAPQPVADLLPHIIDWSGVDHLAQQPPRHEEHLRAVAPGADDLVGGSDVGED